MRLGLYGGTFDPIHNAHIAVAEAAAASFQLDKLLVIPNKLPPHKETDTNATYPHRLAMARLACLGHPPLEASAIEDHDGKSYTIQTLRRLRNVYGDSTEFFFLIGADAFAEVLTWYEVEEVFRMTFFIVASRPGFSYVPPPGARIFQLDKLAMPESSTRIRSCIAEGKIPDTLPRPVAEYIELHGLYRAGVRTVSA